MERATRSPQSRHRKRRLLEALQHVSSGPERCVVEAIAAQVSAVQSNEHADAVNACVNMLRNVKNSVYLRAMAARALGLLMLQSRPLADRLRLETEGLVDALLQLVAYCRRSKTQTADTRRVHVNCCLVISLLMQAAPPQQQHLRLVVSLDSELLVLHPQPSERESANLLLTVAGRPESGDVSRSPDHERSSAVFRADTIEPLINSRKKVRRRKPRKKMLPPQESGSKNQQSPPKDQQRKVAWEDHRAGQSTDPEIKNNFVHPGRSEDRQMSGEGDANHLAGDISRRETPSRVFRMERFRVVAPVFPRQYKLDPPLNPLPLIQPTGLSGSRAIPEEQNEDRDDESSSPAIASAHPSSSTLLYPTHMLEILRTRQMPLASPAYFHQHLHDKEDNLISKIQKQKPPSRLEIVNWDRWRMDNSSFKDESGHEAIAAVTAMPRTSSPAMKFAVTSTTNASKPQTSLVVTDFEPATPELKRQRLREILSSPVDPNESNARQLRSLAKHVNTSIMTSLGSEITRIRHEEHHARQQMHSMIQQERGRLPMKFLFQLPGGAGYCRHRMRRAMALWILEFEDNQRRMALTQWKAVVEHARFVERGEEYHRVAIKKRLKIAIEYVLRGFLQQGLRKWVETTQVLIWRDRDDAVRLIQMEIRRYLGRQHFLLLHRSAPFANLFLRDIYLAPPRPHLPFRIPNEVRQHRRQLWLSAERVQGAYRYRRFRIALARYRVAVVKIQAVQRMRAVRSRYCRLRRQIILVQARVRMRVCRDEFLTLRNAALLVQAVFRSVRMRRLRRLVLCAQRKESERVLSSTVLLQRVGRGFLGRCAARELRQIRDQEWHAALIFQRCWYKRNNEWSTFLLLGCLREKENEEREFDARVLAYKRNHMARAIRRAWLGYLGLKQSNAAILIQRNVRRRAAQQLVDLMRRQKMAHRRIKWFFRVNHVNRISTATKLQFWWLKAVPGRLSRHLNVRRLDQQQETMRLRFEREEDSSSRMQALVRGHMGRKRARRERSACSIQRAMRRHLQRKRFREEVAGVRKRVAQQASNNCIDAALSRVLDSTLKLYNSSACSIQRIVRGCRCRAHVMRNIVYTELQTRMAVRIQSKWRQTAHHRAARKLLQAQRRKHSNPFQSDSSMSVIIKKMVALSAKLYNPDDELQGMAIQEWLRRLGLSLKYGELFQKHRWININYADALKRLRELGREDCKEKLNAIGILDAEDLQILLTNLFAFKTVEETAQQRQLLAVAKEKQIFLQRKCDLAQKHLQACLEKQKQHEAALDEVLLEAKEFRNPPKAVRTKQTEYTRELEDAVKRTSLAHNTRETAVALYAAHTRELASQQQQFATLQEPKEISAVHTLRYFQLIDQLSVAREMFLERFPGRDARALSFVGSLEESQITRWQLQRFFAACTTISDVKQTMKDLTHFTFETEVKRHDHARYGECADILQFGQERLVDLAGIAIEVALGIDREGLSKCGLFQRVLLDTLSASKSARSNTEKARISRTTVDSIAKMDATATKIQSLWRRRVSNKFVANLRVNRRHQEIRDQYLVEFHADRVTPIWQIERNKEQEALDEWLKEEAKAHRIRLLYDTLRYPYVEEWDGELQAYVYAVYSQRDAEQTSDDQNSYEQTHIRSFVTEKPTYSIKEEDMAIRIQAQIRCFLAQRHTKELQRLHRRRLKRAALEAEWDNTRQERSQLLTLKFQIQFQGTVHVNTWLSGRVKSNSVSRSRKRMGNTNPSKPNSTPSDTKGISPSRKSSHTYNSSGSGPVVADGAIQDPQRAGIHATLDAAVSSLEPAYHASMRAEHHRSLSFPANSRPGNAHGGAIVRLLEQLPRFCRHTAPTAQVQTSLRYTKMALRFGWEEVQSMSTDALPYFFNSKTYETSWDRPDYSFDEQFAAIRIQALTRGMLAVNVRERELSAISLASTVQNGIAFISRERREKAIFVHYRRCAERCLVYAANLKLLTLRRELSTVLQSLRRLFPSPASASVSPARRSQVEDTGMLGTITYAALPVVRIPPEEEELWLKKTLSRYPQSSAFTVSQLAQYLRKEALERVLAWEHFALLCQSNFRMIRVRRWYIATQRYRTRAAMTIQCSWRSLGAREARALLESQQRSPYEQRLDKRTGTFYFVYIPTDEKLLEEPRDEVTGGILPFRPMVQDRLTKRWILAWPHYVPASRSRSSKPASGVRDTPWVSCSVCTAERAARRCNECYSPTGDYVDFCLACFYDRHFPVVATTGSEDINWHTYTALSALSTPFFRCVECSRPSTLRCLPCDEHYCERCFSRVHARGKTRSRHPREWYAAQAEPCAECEMRVACQRCLTCQDSLCESCMTRTHARGRRADGKTHTIELLAQLLDPLSGDVYCEQCQARRGDERCDFCTQTLCAVCHWSSTSSSGVRGSRHALVCVETALAEKRRELLGDGGLCVECGKAADRECGTCGDRYCSVRWMGNPGCFERFHSKGKRADHTFTMVEVPTEMPQEIKTLEEQVRAKRRRDAEEAEHEAKRLVAALLEERETEKKLAATMKKKKAKKSKSKKRLDVPEGRRPCAVPQCRRQALALESSGISFCSEHFTLQHALEVAGKDPLEAARLLALVEGGGGRAVDNKKTGWQAFLLDGSFAHKNRDAANTPKAKAIRSSRAQAESSGVSVSYQST